MINNNYNKIIQEEAKMKDHNSQVNYNKNKKN